MRVTRRLAVAGGVGSMLAASAWAQEPGNAGGRKAREPTKAKLVIGKSGHILTPTVLSGDEGFSLMDNGVLTAVNAEAPGLGTARMTAIRKMDNKAVYTSFGTPLKPVIAGHDLSVRVAVRGLGPYARANEVPMQFVLGTSVFEEWVVELDFLASTIDLIAPGKFRDPDALPFESSGRAPGQFFVPLQIGDVAAKAVINLGYSGVAMISHPKVGEWINDGRKVWEQGSELVWGTLTTRQQQVAFVSPLIKLGPWRLGEVNAIADVGHIDGIDATLGVTAMRPFKVWLDGSRNRVWLKVNTS